MQGKVKSALLAGAGAVCLLLTVGCSAREEPVENGGFGLFSWDSSVMEEAEADTLRKCVQRAGVNQIYQTVLPAEDADGALTAGFVRRMSGIGVTVYALLGDARWAVEPDGRTLLDEMEKITAYNAGRSGDEKIIGVMVDVEPYLLEEWDNGDGNRRELMEAYLSGIIAGYGYAAANDLEYWVCVPTFYDVTSKDILKELISGGCDGVAVMNYNRADEYGQMVKEVEYARANSKGVICIYELQQPGEHGLEPVNTYADLGLESLWASARHLASRFGYDRLQFAYHYYAPLMVMVEEMAESDYSRY